LNESMFRECMYAYIESIYSNVKEIRMVVAIRLFNNEHQ
jgi:hypothetical protein